jgi:hypothetical protein
MRHSTSPAQDSEFIEAMGLKYLLEQAADYIAANFDPDDVFSEEKLKEWALDNGFVEDKDE